MERLEHTTEHLRGWVTGERDTLPDLPKNKGQEGFLGEGRKEEGGKDSHIQQSSWTLGYDGSEGVCDRRETHRA